jgi:hypothetical protein
MTSEVTTLCKHPLVFPKGHAVSVLIVSAMLGASLLILKSFLLEKQWQSAFHFDLDLTDCKELLSLFPN